MQYGKEKDSVEATGNVRVVYMDMELEADQIEFFRTASYLIAEGNIRFKKEEYSLTAEKMEYHLFNSTGVVFNADGLNSGIYYYTLEANGMKMTNKMILIK